MRKIRARSLGWEDPLEEGTATHSSILAWKGAWQATYIYTYLYMYISIHAAADAKSLQLCLTLCDPIDFTGHGILQGRILK